VGPAHAFGVATAEIAAFYRDHWARPIALSLPGFADWQFCAAPEAEGRNHCVLALRGDRILGVMGVTPAVFHPGPARLRGAELTTWIIAPEARGQGIGQRILAQLQASFDILLGAGITAAALPLYLGADFAHLAHVPRFFHIADDSGLHRFAQPTAAALALVRGRQARAPTRPHSATACAAADLAPLAGGLRALRRDAPGLDWRFDRHPVYRHECHRVTDAQAPGRGAGIVLRADRVADTPILHVLDLFGDPADLPAAIAFAEARARQLGAAFVDITATSGLLAGHLRARGWSSAVDDPLVELPSLFHPVELRRPPTTSLVVWARQGREGLYDLSRLHVTKGDLDLDRPTLAYLRQGGA
jgi:GNAT superfamily N-acetyltransferase